MVVLDRTSAGSFSHASAPLVNAHVRLPCTRLATEPCLWYYGRMKGKQPRFPNKYVVIGVMTLLLGLMLLLWTVGELKHPVNLWPVGLLIVGLVFLYFRMFHAGPDSYLFLGIAAFLSGILLLITKLVVHLELTAIWPFFMMICGVALLVYGLRKRGYTRLSLAVPGVATLMLSFLFLPFSLGIIKRPFAEVVTDWWPVILVVLGIALLVLHLVREKAERQ